ncbi:MAG: hypothetical protein Q9213_004770 [Squamulea squamosa]
MEVPKVIKRILQWHLDAVVRPAKSVFEYQEEIRQSHYKTLRQSHNPLMTHIVCYFLPDTAARSSQIQKIILGGKDDDVLFLRQAVTDECNLIAVAGAIVAQVAITGLSLQNLSSTHWVVRACFLFAVTSGCLAVYYSCVLQRTIGQLHNPGLIRDWLSSHPGESDGSGSTFKVSLAAAFILSAPFNMMKASIGSFLVGLAIYQGFIWTRSLDTNAGPGDSRKVFIAFMVGAGSCVLFYIYSFSSKMIENILYSRFKLDNLWRVREREAGHAPNAQQRMENDPAPVGLSAALEAAAQAHLQCAEAETRVALEYSRAFHTKCNDKEKGGLPQNERSEPCEL